MQSWRADSPSDSVQGGRGREAYEQQIASVDISTSPFLCQRPRAQQGPPELLRHLSFRSQAWSGVLDRSVGEQRVWHCRKLPPLKLMFQISSGWESPLLGFLLHSLFPLPNSRASFLSGSLELAPSNAASLYFHLSRVRGDTIWPHPEWAAGKRIPPCPRAIAAPCPSH